MVFTPLGYSDAKKTVRIHVDNEDKGGAVSGNIVGLNIDISAYTEGCYTVSVENSQESFTGEFNSNTTGIEKVRSKRAEVSGHYIYNLQGQRLNTLQRGLNIVDGRKFM